MPIMGECHYSRIDERYWRQALTQMKDGGIEVVTTYAIWIHHEELEGEFLFEGRRDLRQFLTLCQELGLYVWLRIGPWCHGEVRHGGFPDWLMAKEQLETEPVKLRYNEPQYLAYVKRYFEQIGRVCEGLTSERGGPIIGIQIENEYGHAGGYQGEEGLAHMKTLTQLAKDCGLRVPYYTATAWGGACTGGLMPVFGGYCEAPWDNRTTELEPNENYSFVTEPLSEGMPYLTAELGGGLQVTSHRRPLIGPKDIGSMALVKLGSGANGLGFYMYHGGTNPVGLLSTLQESKATGYANDYPVFSYDFQAPVGEFGELRSSYYEIKCIAEFIKVNELELAQSCVYIPEEEQALRYSIRYIKEEASLQGFLFYNQYHRHQTMLAVLDFAISVDIEGELLQLPPISIEADSYGVMAFNATKSLLGYEGQWTEHYPLSELAKSMEENSEMLTIKHKDRNVAFQRCEEDEEKITYQLHVEKKEDFANPLFAELVVTYQGDQIQVYQNEKMIHDAFYYGKPYRLDLARYGYPKDLTLVVIKPQKDGKVYYEPGYEPKEVGISKIQRRYTDEH